MVLRLIKQRLRLYQTISEIDGSKNWDHGQLRNRRDLYGLGVCRDENFFYEESTTYEHSFAKLCL